MRKFRFEVVPPNPNPCVRCNGTGNEWATRRDGQPDRRYVFPIGPCRECEGTGVAKGVAA